MQHSIIYGAAVLLALAPTALSVGTAHVVNNCGFDVYYASVAQNVAAPMIKLPASGFSEVYSLANVGISIKVAPSASAAPTQFEFTWASGKINYDISNINGNPFEAWGMTLTPSMAGDSAFPTCQVVSCPAGQTPCTEAYNQPDDTRTMVCNQNSDLTFTLCPSGSSARSVTSSSSEAPAVSTLTTSVAAATATAAAAATSSTGWGHGHNRNHARHLPTK